MRHVLRVTVPWCDRVTQANQGVVSPSACSDGFRNLGLVDVAPRIGPVQTRAQTRYARRGTRRRIFSLMTCAVSPDPSVGATGPGA